MDRNTSIGILFGVGIVVVLAFGLAMFPAQSEDTIILVNKNGNDPVNSCAPGNGLILAQNLTDLCDVVIVSPSTNQILKYNGSFWVNVAQTTFNDTTTCNNIGVGDAFVCVEGTNVNLRSILNGTGIIVNNNTNTITITNTRNNLADLEDTNIVLPASCDYFTYDGSGFNKWINLPQDFIYLEGTSIDISFGGIGADCSVTFTNTAPDNTLCANVGTGTIIYKDGECNFKTLVGSADISIANTTNTIVIDYNGTHVTQVTSNNNNTIGVVPTTGNVVLYPKYELLCQTTLGSANATISCNGFSARTNLIINTNLISNGGTGVEPALRFNGDSGTNYAVRTSSNGGADATITNTSRCNLGSNAGLNPTTDTIKSEIQFDNFASSRKIGYGFKTAGSDTADTTAPNKVEVSCKWDNTSAQITTVTLISFSGTGNYNTGSQLTIWGYN